MLCLCILLQQVSMADEFSVLLKERQGCLQFPSLVPLAPLDPSMQVVHLPRL